MSLANQKRIKAYFHYGFKFKRRHLEISYVRPDCGALGDSESCGRIFHCSAEGYFGSFGLADQ